MNQSNAGIHPPPRRPDSGSTFANIFPIRGFNALCCALSLEGVIVYISYVDYHLWCQSWPWTEIFLVLPNEWMQTLTFVSTLFNSKGFLCLWRCCWSCISIPDQFEYTYSSSIWWRWLWISTSGKLITKVGVRSAKQWCGRWFIVSKSSFSSSVLKSHSPKTDILGLNNPSLHNHDNRHNHGNHYNSKQLKTIIIIITTILISQ